MSLRAIYEHEMALLGPCRAMTARGLAVNEPLRQSRITALAAEANTLAARALPLVEPLRAKLKRPELIWKRAVCKTCRNGKKKRLTCAACGGAGSSERVSLKVGSDSQLKDILYNGLRLPRRTNGGRETTDEEALQSLLALDTSGLVALTLRYAKLATMREIYERLEPGRDGRVRTVFNPAGTYTGRFSASGAFYIPNSTNLQNLPAASAAHDPLYNVRECVVPRPGTVFLYADLSQAEARVVACLAEEDHILERWRVNPEWSIHRWLASLTLKCKEEDVRKDSAAYFLFKQSVHGFSYGEGATTFWRNVNAKADLTGYAITLTQAKQQRAEYMALRPSIDAVWWTRVQRLLEAEEPLRNCFGRVCNFYPRFDPFTNSLDSETLRAAIAWEPQSTVSHLTKLALLELYRQESGNGFHVVFEGHDSVMLEVDVHRVRTATRLAKRALEREIVVHGRSLTIPSEVFVCRKNWSDMERVA